MPIDHLSSTRRDCRYLLHDRDTKYTQSFRATIVSGRVEPLVLPARRVNLNAYAERWVRSVKEECLSKVILVCTENSNPSIMVVESAENGDRFDASSALNRKNYRRIFVQ